MGCVLNKLRLWRSHNASKKYEVGNIDEKTADNILDELSSSSSTTSVSLLELMTEYPIKKEKIERRRFDADKERCVDVSQDVNNILRIQKIFKSAYIEQEQMSMRYGSQRVLSMRSSSIKRTRSNIIT
jgi:hypothetical protein